MCVPNHGVVKPSQKYLILPGMNHHVEDHLNLIYVRTNFRKYQINEDIQNYILRKNLNQKIYIKRNQINDIHQ